MNRTETTKKLSDLLAAKFNKKITYWASEVTFDWGTLCPTRVDFMTFEPQNQSVSGIEKGIFTCYEVKSCRADFESKNGHNFYGEKNYYVMPHATFLEVNTKILGYVGVYAEIDGELKCVKPAKPIDRKRPLVEMLFLMFRSGR